MTSTDVTGMLMPFRTLIRQKCGVTFKNDGLHVLESAIGKRITSLNLPGHAEYLQIVSRNEEELHLLIDLITINETYFFREKHHFDLLCDTIIPQILAEKKDKIRILSAGCSTGEEPFSILIALIEKYGMGIKARVEIHGVDIDTNVIEAAKMGRYGKNSFRNDEHTLLKYFEKHRDHHYHLSPGLRECVTFNVCNLLTQPFPSFLRNMDVIFYRNVSIYFDRETQQAIFQNLSELLNPDGRIFLSSTETYYHNVGILSLKQCGDIFLYQKNSLAGATGHARKSMPAPVPKPAVASVIASKPLLAQLAPCSSQVQTAPKLVVKNQDAATLFESALADAEQKRYASAIAKLDELLCMDITLLKAHALKAGVLINQEKIDAARAVCHEILALDEWNLEAHLLLGVIARVKDEHDEAKKMFKTALYIRSTCWLPHYYLAEIYYAEHDPAGAYREYGATLKLLENRGVREHGLTYFPLSFHAEQLIHLCRHHMNKIGGLHKKAGHS